MKTITKVGAVIAAAAVSMGLFVTSSSAATGQNRIGASDAFATSAQIAQAYGTASAVIIANGDAAKDGADALAANFLAGVKHAPIILTSAKSIGSAQIAAVKKVLAGASHPTIFVIGKSDSVSDAIVSKLLGAVPGARQTRLAGNNRYETAAAIIKAAGVPAAKIGVSGKSPVSTAILASGQVNADALAAGPLSAAWGIPVILTMDSGLPAASVAALKAAGIKHLIVLGKTDRIPAKILTQAAKVGASTSTRIGGSNRFETSALIYQAAMTSMTNSAGATYGAKGAQGVFLVNGMNGFGEALAGGPLAALTESGMVTTNGKVLDAKVSAFLAGISSASVTALGAAAKVPSSVSQAAASAMGGSCAVKQLAQSRFSPSGYVTVWTDVYDAPCLDARGTAPQNAKILYTIDQTPITGKDGSLQYGLSDVPAWAVTEANGRPDYYAYDPTTSRLVAEALNSYRTAHGKASLTIIDGDFFDPSQSTSDYWQEYRSPYAEDASVNSFGGRTVRLVIQDFTSNDSGNQSILSDSYSTVQCGHWYQVNDTDIVHIAADNFDAPSYEIYSACRLK